MKEFVKKNKKKILVINIIIIVIISLVICYILFLKPKINITLNNTTSPTNNITEVEVLTEYNDAGVSTCYGNKTLFKKSKCKDLSSYLTTIGTVDTSVLGDYTIKYVVDYHKKRAEKTRVVKVVDTTPPELVLNEGNTACPNKEYVEAGYTSIDNYDLDITDKVQIEKVDNTITYTSTDSSNNTTTLIRDIVYIDDVAPVITLNSGETINVVLGSNYNEAGYKATDNCDEDITDKVTIKSNVNTDSVGTYTIEYSVTDNAGNVATATRTVKVYKQRVNTVHVPSGKTIYLTFDDGPSAYTFELLDILKRYNVKATFFVTATRPGYNYNITRAYNEGHAIGLHTATHNYYNIYQSVDAYFNDLNTIDDLVYSLTGNRSKLIRFPGGSSNTVSRNVCAGIMTTLARETQNRGYSYFDWNVSSGDAAGNNPSTQTIANNVISSLGGGSTYIVLQHDINYNSVKAVPQIIEYGLANGYNFAPLNINSPTAHHAINN
ncbi:MAG: polysaccharide deacetylase family protein [bacterium]|nr:polysaccharide deacetylase family protein [bacterium]